MDHFSTQSYFPKNSNHSHISQTVSLVPMAHLVLFPWPISPSLSLIILNLIPANPLQWIWSNNWSHRGQFVRVMTINRAVTTSFVDVRALWSALPSHYANLLFKLPSPFLIFPSPLTICLAVRRLLLNQRSCNNSHALFSCILLLDVVAELNPCSSPKCFGTGPPQHLRYCFDIQKYAFLPLQSNNNCLLSRISGPEHMS